MNNDVNVFKDPWFVTDIRECERSGSIIGYEVSLFLPFRGCFSEENLYFGYAKSLFVKDIGNIITGDLVYLGFSKKYKNWYIKNR